MRHRRKPKLHAHHLGPHPIIRHYLERMNFRGIIRGAMGSGLQQGLDHAEVLSVLVHNILVSRGAMYRVREWAEKIEPDALGLTASQVARLNDDRIGRSLDALASQRGRSVFFRLALRVIKDFKLRIPRVHFDTTSVTFFGRYEGSRSSSEPRITYGHNKDHRPDLKQLVFGLNITSDGAVPLLHHIYSGNRTDDSVHVQNLDLLRSLLGTDDFIYVADSKLCTTKNLAHVASYGGKFVTVLPRTRKEDKVFRARLRKGPVVRWRKFHEIPNHRCKSEPPDVLYTTTEGSQATKEGYRIVWVRSSHKALLDEEGRNERLRKAEVEFHELGPKLGSRKLKTRTEINNRVKQVLAKLKVKDFLDVQIATYTVTELKYARPGRPCADSPMRKVTHKRFKLIVARNKKAIREARRIDGVFPMVTNMDDIPKRKVVEIYKYQPYLEKRFAYTKSDYSAAPIFLKKKLRVVGLLHVYFVAIMVAALLERQVRAAMTVRKINEIPILPEGRDTSTPTTPRILENFTDAVWHEFQEGERYVSFPVALNSIQELLLTLADVPHELYR